jgi:hypothetical protein
MLFFVLKYLMLEVIVRFVDIGGIVDHYWLMFNISFYNIVLDVFNGHSIKEEEQRLVGMETG